MRIAILQDLSLCVQPIQYPSTTSPFVLPVPVTGSICLRTFRSRYPSTIFQSTGNWYEMSTNIQVYWVPHYPSNKYPITPLVPVTGSNCLRTSRAIWYPSPCVLSFSRRYPFNRYYIVLRGVLVHPVLGTPLLQYTVQLVPRYPVPPLAEVLVVLYIKIIIGICQVYSMSSHVPRITGVLGQLLCTNRIAMYWVLVMY